MTQTAPDFAAIAAEALTNALRRPQVDESRVLELIAEHAPKTAAVEIKVAGKPAPLPAGTHHAKFPLLLTCLANNVNVMLVGEAGSGKTTAAHKAAEVFGLEFYAQSFCQLTSKADLQGYMSANGDYVTTNFRRAFEFGGVFCADEFDAGNANANVIINQALANGAAGFPDGMTPRNQDFLVVACANTFGKGATAKFVGRNKLDAATLDRFAVIEWNIDEALEASFLGIEQKAEEFDMEEGGIIDPATWLQICRKARQRAQEIGAEMVISPRAIQAGAQLSAAGVGRKHLEEMLIWKGADAATRAKIGDLDPTN